ncbi:surface protein D, putative [Babesia bigemina]|uniref:Surface protein D, putative n=1 Tax=Babesia bigemina TaxID=5866 RepID=A0A061DBF9_BABBI|nr:surface protein D, putative [Babesia bigemina]CDR97873.1 surface protein D, putative [Babesia bigemina]|eukprot:XP_012770059.1 surface protein D, putative [Babesia bigemina]
MVCSKILAIAFCAIAAFSTVLRVEAGCSEEHVQVLGFSSENVTEDSLKRGREVAGLLRKLMLGNLTKTGAKDTTPLTNKFTKTLTKAGYPEIPAECLSCFVQSAQCVMKECKGACIAGDQSPGCVKCFMAHCADDLHACVGHITINIGEHKNAGKGGK